MASPRMTLEDVVVDMRSHGISINKKTLSECLKQGVFPFASIVSISPTGRANFMIMRRDYQKWAEEYLNC